MFVEDLRLLARGAQFLTVIDQVLLCLLVLFFFFFKLFSHGNVLALAFLSLRQLLHHVLLQRMRQIVRVAEVEALVDLDLLEVVNVACLVRVGR